MCCRHDIWFSYFSSENASMCSTKSIYARAKRADFTLHQQSLLHLYQICFLLNAIFSIGVNYITTRCSKRKPSWIVCALCVLCAVDSIKDTTMRRMNSEIIAKNGNRCECEWKTLWIRKWKGKVEVNLHTRCDANTITLCTREQARRKWSIFALFYFSFYFQITYKFRFTPNTLFFSSTTGNWHGVTASWSQFACESAKKRSHRCGCDSIRIAECAQSVEKVTTTCMCDGGGGRAGRDVYSYLRFTCAMLEYGVNASLSHQKVSLKMYLCV